VNDFLAPMDDFLFSIASLTEAEIADAEIQNRLSCPFNQVDICNSLLSEQGSEAP
jgi:hypothetical protein